MKNEKNKTKQFIVPAKYIIECVVDDKKTVYPVALSILDGRTNATHYVKTRNDLYDLCLSADVYRSSLLRICRKENGTFIDLSKNGRFTVDADFMPERRHMETLMKKQVKDMYGLLFCNPDQNKMSDL